MSSSLGAEHGPLPAKEDRQGQRLGAATLPGTLAKAAVLAGAVERGSAGAVNRWRASDKRRLDVGCRQMPDQLPKALGGPQLRTIAMPADANAGGSVFGGWTLSQMDLACGSFAAERAGGRVATVSIDAMRFLRPVAIGDEVSCYCSLGKAGETSVVVKVETWARGRGRGKAAEKVTEGVFTFVAIDDAGHPRPLPEEPKEAGT